MSSLNDFDFGAASADRPTSAPDHTLASPTSHSRRRANVLQHLPVLLIAGYLSGCGSSKDVDAAACTDDESCEDGWTCDTSSGICSMKSTPDAGTDTTPKSTLAQRWQCVNDSADVAVPDPSDTVELRVGAVDLLTLKSPADLKASACDADDADCSAPIVDAVAADSDGYFSLDVPRGWNGYISFAAPGYVPGLWYYGRPVLQDSSSAGPLMVTPSTLVDLTEFAGVRNDAEHGTALVQVWDCDSSAADGVRLQDIAEQKAFYFDGTLPSRTKRSTSISTALGLTHELVAVGGYSFLPPSSPAKFIAELDNETHDVIAIQPAYIRAAHITYVGIFAGNGLK